MRYHMFLSRLVFQIPLASLAMVGLFGCAGVSKSSTVVVAKPKIISLAKPYSWYEAHSTFGRNLTFRYTLAAGNYIGAREDSGGTYYEGQGNCLNKKVVLSNIDSFVVDAVWTQRCGVYVSRVPGAAPKVYYYNLGSTYQNPGMTNSQPVLTPRPNANPDMVATNAAISTPGLSPLQAGIGAGIGAALGGIMQEKQNEARLNNMQFLFYQPDKSELKNNFGIP